MSPQFLYDNQGNALGVFLSIEDWNQIKDIVDQNNELPHWQRGILDHRLLLLQQNPNSVTPLDNFLMKMEKEANEDCEVKD